MRGQALQLGLQLARDGELPVGAHTGAQAAEFGLQTHLGRALDPAGLAGHIHLPAVGPRPLQAEFVQPQALAFEPGAQPAATQLDAVDHRAQGQVVGRQRPAQQGLGAGAAQLERGLQRAAQPPAGRRQRRPHAQPGQARLQLAAERGVVWPLPAAVTGARQLGAHPAFALAGALAVPAPAQHHGLVVSAQCQARVAHIGVHAGGQALAGFGVQVEVATAPLQLGLQAQGLAPLQVPAAVEHHVPGHAGAAEQRPGQQLGPAQGQAAQAAGGAQLAGLPVQGLPGQQRGGELGARWRLQLQLAGLGGPAAAVALQHHGAGLLERPWAQLRVLQVQPKFRQCQAPAWQLCTARQGLLERACGQAGLPAQLG